MSFTSVVGNDFNLEILKGGILRPFLSLEVRLYAAVTPGLSPSSGIDDFDESDFPGYNRISLPDPFSVSKDGNCVATAFFEQVIFTPEGSGPSGDVLGYFVVDIQKFLFCWGGQLFPTAVPVDGNSDKVRVSPTFKIQSKFSSTSEV